MSYKKLYIVFKRSFIHDNRSMLVVQIELDIDNSLPTRIFEFIELVGIT